MKTAIRKSRYLLKLSTLALAGSLVPVSYSVTAQQAGRLEEIVVTARRVEETLQSVPVAVSAFTGLQLERAGVESMLDVQSQVPNMRFRSNNEAGGGWIIMRGQNQVSGELNTDSPVGYYFDGVNMPRSRGMSQSMFDMERIEVLKGPQGTLYGRNTMAGAINIISKKPSHADGVTGFVQGTVGTRDLYELGGAVNLPVTDNFSTRFAVQRLKRDGFSKQLSTFPASDLSRDYKSLDDANQIFFRGSALWDPTENINVHLVMDWKELDEAPRSVHHTAAATSPTHQMYQRIAAIEGITGTPTERGLAAMAIYQSYQDGDYYTDYGDGTGSTIGVLPARGSYYNDYGGGLTVSVAFDNFNLTSITGYRYQTVTNVNDLDGMPYRLSSSSSSDEGDFYSQEIRLDGDTFEDRLHWQLGAYYSFEDAHHFGYDDPDPAVTAVNNPFVRENFFENTSWAGFAQIGWAFTDALNLTLGGRYTEEQKDLVAMSRDYRRDTWPDLTIGRCRVPPGTQPVTACRADFSDKFDKWSYLVSLDYQLNQDVMIYASTATGWRGGGQNSRGNITTLSFASFGPDTATNYEVGLKGDWFDNSLRTNLAIYHTKLEDLQRRRNITAGALTAVVQTNAADATIQGFELDLTSTPIDGLTLRASVGLTDASYDEFNDLANDGVTIIDRSNEPFEGVSKWNYTLDSRYEWQVGSGTVGAGANWSWESKQDHYLTIITDPAIPREAAIIKPYGLLNVRLDYTLDNLGLEFALWGRNVLDKKYLTRIQDSVAGNGYFLAFPGTRALWGLEVKKDF